MPRTEFGSFTNSPALSKLPIGSKPTFDPSWEVITTHVTTPEGAIVKGIAADSSGDKVGVFGSTVTGVGVWARSNSPEGLAAMFEGNVVMNGALHARGSHLFDGDVDCTGDISLKNADCAEDFSVRTPMEPGTVMVLNDDGGVSECRRPYDKRVAGVISGAGSYKPAIVLDRQKSAKNRQPIALMGKVYCKVDAQFGAIEVGDLLTTSSTPGHAMLTREASAAFGAVVGKAMCPLREGTGMIPVLIALQ